MAGGGVPPHAWETGRGASVKVRVNLVYQGLQDGAVTRFNPARARDTARVAEGALRQRCVDVGGRHSTVAQDAALQMAIDAR